MNLSIRELESLRPRLRTDLHFSVQEHGSERVCVIEDSAASKFHRVGFDEYRFFRSLDGTQNVAAILARLARDGDGNGYTEGEALHLVRWLKDNHLLAVDSGRAGTEREQDQNALRGAVAWLNPLFLRVPLGRPDRFFAWLAARLRPFLGWFGFLLWLGLVIAGVSQVAVNKERFAHGFEGILARDNWLWLLMVWAVLKILHECAHGVFCRHFGAKVREIGVIFVLFVPMGYVDATASIGIASRWRRIGVALAGMYAEFAIAAFAALWWAATPDGQQATILHNTIIMGSVVSLFFNLNPLMRFDGYYVLSDLVGIPNLAPRARAWLMRAFTWLLIGGARLRPERPRTLREWFIAVYGIAAWAWQFVVFASLTLAASVLLRGGGLIFAALAAAVWVVVPLVVFSRQIVAHLRGGTGRALPLAARVCVIVGIAAAVIFVPYHKTVVAVGVVEFGDTRVLRSECPGFVESVHARDGDEIAAGALLVVLRNDEADANLAKIRRELEAQERRARVAYTRGEVSDYQSQQARAEAMHKSVLEMERYLSTLAIRAPISGRVTSRMIAQSAGAYFPAGEEILRIGEFTGREVKLAVAQETGPHFRAAHGHVVRVRVDGRGDVFDGTLERLDDQAGRALPHHALTAMAGGPLPVRRIEGDAFSHEHFELVEPHFTATVRLPDGAPIADGELARVKFHSPVSVTILGELRTAFARWARKYGA